VVTDSSPRSCSTPSPIAAPVDDHLGRRLFERRIVFLAHEVDDESAHRVVSQLLVLSGDDERSDITLVINSPGGSVLAGLAVYDTMQLIPNDVVTVAAGLAASMGQVLLCAGAPGKRYALPNAHVLMHEGSAGIGGAAADVAIQAANLVDTLERMRNIVARHTGRTIEEITGDMGRDRWFDADGARAYGFVDHVATSIDEVVPRLPLRRIGVAAGVDVVDEIGREVGR
jgi:ATP-dependent Clp protease protease subunit